MIPDFSFIQEIVGGTGLDSPGLALLHFVKCGLQVGGKDDIFRQGYAAV